MSLGCVRFTRIPIIWESINHKILKFKIVKSQVLQLIWSFQNLKIFKKKYSQKIVQVTLEHVSY